MSKLKNKVALLAGGSTSHLRAWSMVLATQGARVFVACPREQDLDGVDDFAVVLRSDLTSVGSLDKLFDTICGEHGAIDLLLVGVDASACCADRRKMSSFDLVFNPQTRGVFFTVQKGLRVLAKDATLAVALPARDAVADGAGASPKTRAAIESFLQTWRSELSQAEIQIWPLEHGGADLRWFIDYEAASGDADGTVECGHQSCLRLPRQALHAFG